MGRLFLARDIEMARTALRVHEGEMSGPEEVVITKGVFSMEESLASLECLNSLEPLENFRILLRIFSEKTCFPIPKELVQKR